MSSSEEGQERQEYLEERQQFNQAEQDAARSFDLAMLILSAGAFGLSIAFVREVSPEPRLVYFLYGAWITFGISLIFILASFLLSQAAWSRQRDILDEMYEDGNRNSEGANVKAKATALLNWLSALCF